MSERRPATTIGELDIHLSNLQTRLSEVASGMQHMATKADIEGIRSSMASLATKAEVAAEINAIREEVQRSKPSTIAKQVAAFCAAMLVVVAFGGFLLTASDWIRQRPAPAVGVKP